MSVSLRVVHLSVVHKADEPRIYERECRTLSDAGYDVTYLAPGATPRRDEHRVRLMPLPSRPRSRRWMSVRDIVAALRDVRPHVLHVHDPELLTLFPPLRPFVPRLVYDMHDYLPEQVLGKDYVPLAWRSFVSRASEVSQRVLSAFGDGVVTAYEDMLSSLGGLPRIRTVAPNYPRLSRFADAQPVADLAADPRLRLVYIGSLSRNRGCGLMLDVMERLERDDAFLILGGSFASPDLEAETLGRLRAGLDDRVVFLGRVPPPELPRYLAAGEVVWMPSLPSLQYVRPNVETKIYEGMAVGLAALVSDMAGRGEFVRREGCGIAVPPTVDGHVCGIRCLMADRGEAAAMGARGRQAVVVRYSWESVENDLLEFYDRVCAEGRQGGRLA